MSENGTIFSCVILDENKKRIYNTYYGRQWKICKKCKKNNIKN